MTSDFSYFGSKMRLRWEAKICISKYHGYTPRHPNKDIELAIRYAEDCGWRYKASGKSSHAWGKLMCVEANRGGCCIHLVNTTKLDFFHNLRLLLESSVMSRAVLLIYAPINCAARSQHALPSNKILDYERSLLRHSCESNS